MNIDFKTLASLLFAIYAAVSIVLVSYWLIYKGIKLIVRNKELKAFQREYDSGYKELFFMIIQAKNLKNKKNLGLEINQLVEIKVAVDERITNLVKAENK